MIQCCQRFCQDEEQLEVITSTEGPPRFGSGCGLVLRTRGLLEAALCVHAKKKKTHSPPTAVASI